MELYTLLLLTLFGYAAVAVPVRDSIPLIEDRKLVSSYSTNVGCEFGGSRYDIDSQWHPILEPYGVMYCLRCTCGAVIKKGLLQQRGQVQCRRISHECPDVSSCPLTAVLPPNSCCKICPQSKDDSLNNADVSGYGRSAGIDPPVVPANSYRVEHQAASAANTNYMMTGNPGRDLHALLTPTVNSTSTDVIGAAYMSLKHSVLRITVQLSSHVDVSEIQLRDQSNGVIFRSDHFTVTEDTYTGTSKICLSWRDSLRYADDISSDSVSLVVSTSPHSTLRGLIKLITPPKLETFSTLMVDSDTAFGYAASLSMGLDTDTKSLHIRGSVLTPSTVRGKHPLTLEIHRDRRLLYTEEIIVSLSANGGSFSTTWESLATPALKQLARGRLTARIYFTTPGALPNVPITSVITTFHTCGGLKSLISGQDALPQYETTAVATAELTLRPNGDLRYQIEVKDIESRIAEVMIEMDRTALSADDSGKITRIAKDINDRATIQLDGVYDKPDATEIQLLLEGKLFINMQTRLRSTSALRGQIILVPTTQEEPILMRDRSNGLASLAWCDTTDCALSCDVLIPRAAVRRDGTTKFYLDYWNQQQLLATFSESNLMEAAVTETELKQIGLSLPTMRIITGDSQLYGQVPIADTCFSDTPADMLPAADQVSQRRGVWVDPQLDVAHKCSYDKKIYADGESWKPRDSNLACVTCSCKRNKAQCHPVVCPAVECDNPVTLPGECCPACPKPTDNTNQTCYFPGDHRNHRVGTVWHPFMHPGGYFKCAICYCKPGGGGYDCKQTGCPALTCPEHRQETLPGECCPSCKAPPSPDLLRVANPAAQLNLMQGDSDSYSSCKVGDKVYSNGETFNPQIGTLGSYGNVMCTCREGKLECSKSQCDCNKKSSRKNRCCMRQCGFSESDMIRKRRRKDKNKHRGVFC